MKRLKLYTHIIIYIKFHIQYDMFEMEKMSGYFSLLNTT